MDSEGEPSSIFFLEDTKLTIEKDSKFSNNSPCTLIFCKEDAEVYVSDTTFSDNKAAVIFSFAQHSDDSYFKNCSFNNNKMAESDVAYLEHAFEVRAIALSFSECDMGDSNYFAIDCLKFVNCTNAPNANARARRFGSMFGDGSLAMIVSLLALVASGTAIFMTVANNKKMTAPASANSTEEADEE